MIQAEESLGAAAKPVDAGVHPDELPVGMEVGGFRLLRHVATGAYGSVWQVESVRHPGHPYALKFCLYRREEHAVADARAVREVQLLMQAAHENVVRVVAYGRWEHPEKGRHYMVLQWVEGGTLRHWVERTRPGPRQVVRLCQKLARALQAAHEAGVVHRDVKPDNVLVCAENGEPFLSDFGIGSLQGGHTLAVGLAQPGTLPFLSPQLLATHLSGAAPHPAQPADDWYALGVVLYLLLSEVLPYPEDLEARELARWVAYLKPVAPHQLNPRVPPALGQVALKLLSLEPSQRYAGGQELCAALEQALATALEPEAALLPAPSPEAALTLPPTPGDGPLARDPEVLDAHAFKQEEEPEEERLDQVRALRDALLRTQGQRRPPRVLRTAVRLASQPWARGVAAALVLGGMVLGAWGLWPRSVPELAASVAPQPPPPMAASGASPHLASSDASPPKEGSPVKTPQHPASPPALSPAAPPKAPKGRTKAALCAAGVALAGCAGVPVRPTRQQCPAEAVAAMQQRDWKIVTLYLDPNSERVGQRIPLRPGPIISAIRNTAFEGPFTSKGMAGLLHGHVFHAEDGRVVVRFTEVELPGGERVPVCFAVRTPVGVFDVFNRDWDGPDGGPAGSNSQTAERVRVLPD
jgi:serine/threonine protein kinase